jgi:hypothetical protein
MRVLIVAFAASVLICVGWSADAQKINDPPWNEEHISHLPAEVRNAVLAMCAQAPNAGHYFALYFHDQINLHFEHFHCEQARLTFCNGSQCLHQVYKLTGGHYHLAKSFYGPTTD